MWVCGQIIQKHGYDIVHPNIELTSGTDSSYIASSSASSRAMSYACAVKSAPPPELLLSHSIKMATSKLLSVLFSVRILKNM